MGKAQKQQEPIKQAVTYTGLLATVGSRYIIDKAVGFALTMLLSSSSALAKINIAYNVLRLGVCAACRNLIINHWLS